MTWTVELFPFNVFEAGEVNIVTGGEDAGYPLTRLYDRAISLFWKSPATSILDIRVDQSADQLPVDFLAINRHNADGAEFWLQYSSDNFASEFNSVAHWWQSGNEQEIRRITAVNSDAWRVYISGLTSPQIGELYLSKGYSFNCLRDSNPYGSDVDQVQWNKSIGGLERSTKLGPKRRVRSYNFMLSPAEFADFETVVGHLDDYSQPFYFKDHADQYYFARFQEMPAFDFSHNTHTRVGIRVLEML